MGRRGRRTRYPQLFVDRLRFIKPVFIGDTLTCKATITEKREHKKPEFGLVVEKVEAINQRGDTVLACEHLYVVEKKG